MLTTTAVEARVGLARDMARLGHHALAAGILGPVLPASCATMGRVVGGLPVDWRSVMTEAMQAHDAAITARQAQARAAARVPRSGRWAAVRARVPDYFDPDLGNHQNAAIMCADLFATGNEAPALSTVTGWMRDHRRTL